jgi:hypothetical protein
VQRDLTQVTAVALAILSYEEARLPVVVALNDMLSDVRKVDARSAWRAVADASKFRRVCLHATVRSVGKRHM